MKTYINTKGGQKMEKEELTKKVILYLINRLEKDIEGRKKLMKLMFLVEHFNQDSQKLVKEGKLGNEFIIYHYGVFSFDVMNRYLELAKEGKIKDNFPMSIINLQKVELPTEIKQDVDGIINIFGKKTGKVLELETLEMLKLNLETKKENFGKPVIQFI